MSSTRYSTHLVSWESAAAALREVRTAVFIREQGIDEALEWDGKDALAIHALATDSAGKPVGAARLLLEGDEAQIGRVAVVSAWRRKGVGACLVGCLLEEAKRLGGRKIFLHAQTPALPFYAACGFAPEGDEFMEDGLPHYRMTCRL